VIVVGSRKAELGIIRHAKAEGSFGTVHVALPLVAGDEEAIFGLKNSPRYDHARVASDLMAGLQGVFTSANAAARRLEAKRRRARSVFHGSGVAGIEVRRTRRQPDEHSRLVASINGAATGLTLFQSTEVRLSSWASRSGRKANNGVPRNSPSSASVVSLRSYFTYDSLHSVQDFRCLPSALEPGLV
jgi:hypothetical protein